MREELAIRVLGHAGLDLDCSGYRIVCDPWPSPRGAFLGTWHPFPDNTMIEPALLHDAPALYISHPHEDHYDKETLRAYPKSVTAIVAKFPGGVLAKKLAALGFANIVELEEWQPHVLADGVPVRVLLDPTRYMLDSCLVVEHGRHVLVNQNDCFLDAVQLARLRALQPAIHVTQFSGASYYPAVYDFARAQMETHVARYTDRLFKRFCDVTRASGARYIVPSAGPPCFLDEHYAINFGGSIFYDTDELLTRIARDAPARRILEDAGLVRRGIEILYP